MPDDPPLRLEIPVRPDRREVVAAHLWHLGASGVWERPGVTVAWFAAPGPDLAAASKLVDELAPSTVTTSVEVDRDWQEAWKATISPIRAGRIAVVPTWLAASHVPAEDELTLILDPGRAFGTGHHATTALCLELLDARDLAGRLAGRTVADIGCGSGILAIAAAARGAEATGVDIDEDAVAVTRDNARRNHVEVAVATGSVDALRAPAEVVVANLVTDVVIALADDLVAVTRSELIVSGITEGRRDDALDALTAAGARLEEVRSRDGWIAARLSVTGPSQPAASSSRHRLRRTSRAGIAILAVLALACSDGGVLGPGSDGPDGAADPSEEQGAAEPEASPEARALTTEVEGVLALVAEARTALAEAAEASTTQDLRSAAEDARVLLVSAGPDGPRALFPSQPSERSTSRDGEDALTDLLASARELDDPLGRDVLAALRDVVAGDLGAWELDAPGMVATAEEAAAQGAESGDLERATERVLTLSGEGTRAIGWTALATTTDDLELAQEAARSAAGHLEVVEIALSSTITDDDPAPEGGADDAEELGPPAPEDAP
ncbi:MAG: 50S ribosomal protein L11 methyltransferase [Nitriliruptoraceae bacterium]